MAKLPDKIEDWTEAPWEKPDAGEFDADRAKIYVFNLAKDAERAQDELATTKVARDALTAERDGFKVRVETLEADTSADDLKVENARLKQEAESARTNARKVMTDAVKNEFGLSERQVGKLDGDDLEALRNDARETFGEPKPGGEGENPPAGEGEQPPAGNPLASQPVRIVNGGDPNGTGGTDRQPSREEALALIKD